MSCGCKSHSTTCARQGSPTRISLWRSDSATPQTSAVLSAAGRTSHPARSERGRFVTSKLPSLHVLEFLPARNAEFAQQIYGPVLRHFTQFEKAFVRLEIRVQNLSGNVFGAIYHCAGGQDAHPAKLCIKTHETGNISFVVLQRINVAFTGLFDEIPIKDLPPVLLVLQPLRANLDSVGEPICEDARRSSDGGAGQSS